MDFVDAAFELGREAGRGDGAVEGAPGEEERVRKKSRGLPRGGKVRK